MRRASLSGAWSGAFRYPRNALPETVFNAQIEEVDGAFVGRIQEPDLFLSSGLGSVITAEIEGVRTGRSVTFTKFYESRADIDHAVRYQGEADEALTRIDGDWIIPGDWSGTFFMVRDDDGAEEAAEVTAEIAAERHR